MPVASVITEGFSSFKQAIANNGHDSGETMKTCESNIASLRKRLENPSTSIDEVKEIFELIEKQQDRQEMIADKRRRHDGDMAAGVVVFGGVVLAVMLSVVDRKHAEHYLKASAELIPKAVKCFQAA